MDATQERKVREIVAENTKNALRMHFKMLQAMTKELETLGLSHTELQDVRTAASAEVSANTYIWTYLNLCVENGDLDILSKAWENPPFRAHALISVIQFVHTLCQDLVNQYPLNIPQDSSLSNPIRDN